MTKLLTGSMMAAVVLMACNPVKQADRNAAKNTVVTVYPQSSFDSVAAKNALTYGTGSISGVVFKRVAKQKGSIYTTKLWGKNVKVILFPVTPYFQEWYDLRKKKEGKLTRVYMSDAAVRFRVETFSDDYGRFTFEKMRPGKYFLQAFLDWYRPVNYKQYTGYATDGYYTTNYYEWKSYNEDHTSRLEEFVEVKSDGEMVQVKLN
ncbi:MAG: hypothetical protein J0I41_10680 [Filimonas sp.]|nr:hypothetical protein [Filimonas sp.]